MSSAALQRARRLYGAAAKVENIPLQDYLKKHNIDPNKIPLKKPATRRKPAVKQAPAAEPPAASEAAPEIKPAEPAPTPPPEAPPQRKRHEFRQNMNLAGALELATDLGHTDILERLEVVVAYALGRNDGSLANNMEQLRAFLRDERLATMNRTYGA